MSTLTGQAINASYEGLLKTLDNAAINGTNRVITDGVGNSLPLEASTTTIKFTGNADFTTATVTGITSGGLTAGSGNDSMESSDALTTVAAIASGAESIALGDSAVSSGDSNVGIGKSVNAGGSYSTAIGRQASVSSAQGTAIGFAAQVTGGSGVALGRVARCFDSDAIGIGNTATANNLRSISIGSNSATSSDDAISIGPFTSTTASGAIALGSSVTGAIADTLSVKAIELQTDSTPTAGGIILSDAGGTDRRINIDAAGGLQIDSTPVGGGGGTPGLIAGTGTDSIISDLTSNSAQASQLGGLAIGSGANAYGGSSNSIGYFAESGNFANAFGTYTGANGSYSTAFGSGCSANGDFALAVGKQAVANSPSSISMGEEATVNNGSTSTYGIAIGRFAESTAFGAVALGAGITAATDNTVTVKLLEIAGYASMNFADDTAAAAGNIPLGGVYHTSGALKIRIV